MQNTRFRDFQGGSRTTGAVPTYRSFQFTESLEGTKASIEKAKSSSVGVPAYMPSEHNYDSIRRQSNTGVLLEEVDDVQGTDWLLIEVNAV